MIRDETPRQQRRNRRDFPKIDNFSKLKIELAEKATLLKVPQDFSEEVVDLKPFAP